MRHSVFVFFLVNVGCSGPVSTTSLKLDAADALAKGTAGSDACANNGWYGDAVCDSFCPAPDEACVSEPSSGRPMLCAEFIEEGNSTCDRPASDPCRFQDPECNSSLTPSSAGGGVVCAALVETTDGVCRRSIGDPCRSQDPDCPEADGTFDFSELPPTSAETASSCPPIIKVAGVCSYASDDPCRSQDPDCAPKPEEVTCETSSFNDCDPAHTDGSAPPLCASGEVPQIIAGNYGACIPKACCAPVVCFAAIEASDNACTRLYNDPCRVKDPDCAP